MQQPGEADDDVQAQGQQRVKPRGRQDFKLILIRDERQPHHRDCKHDPSERWHQARSATRSPSRPVGLNINSKTRTTNANTFFHCDDRYPAPSASSTPNTSPPTMAPGMLPMPPSTAAVNAFSPIR